MSRFKRVLLGGLAALPLVLLTLSHEASAAAVTIGGCYFPTVSVGVFEGNFFDDITLSDDSGRRKDQCKDFLNGCRKTIRHVTNCVESGFAATENASYEECKEFADPNDRADCRDGLKQDAAAFKENLDSNTSSAEQKCRDCYESCLAGESCLVQE